MDAQRLSLLKRKLETLNYDGELDPTSAPLTEKACHTRCVLSVSTVSAEALVKICRIQKSCALARFFELKRTKTLVPFLRS